MREPSTAIWPSQCGSESTGITPRRRAHWRRMTCTSGDPGAPFATTCTHARPSVVGSGSHRCATAATPVGEDGSVKNTAQATQPSLWSLGSGQGGPGQRVPGVVGETCPTAADRVPVRQSVWRVRAPSHGRQGALVTTDPCRGSLSVTTDPCSGSLSVTTDPRGEFLSDSCEGVALLCGG